MKHLLQVGLLPLLGVGMLACDVTISPGDPDDDTLTRVSINLAPTGPGFAEVERWEASLYAGATPGQETSGRFTEWVEVERDQVNFDLPADVREGDELPIGVPGDTYVRVRAVSDRLPDFDIVSAPFTLVEGHQAIALSIDSVVTPVPDKTDLGSARVLVGLSFLGYPGPFGRPGTWEASLYSGAVPGEESSGRFTAWKPVLDQAIAFDIPEELRDGHQAPFGLPEDTYVRIRSIHEDDYPAFDLVSRPFTLDSGDYAVHFAVRSQVVRDP